MKTFLQYFTAGIIPIACFSLSVLAYKKGLFLLNNGNNLFFVLGLVVVALFNKDWVGYNKTAQRII
jgi:hypothetical protein